MDDSDDELNYEDVLDVDHLLKKPESLPNPSPPISQLFEQPHSVPSTPCGGPTPMAKRNSTGIAMPFRQSKEVVSVLMTVFDLFVFPYLRFCDSTIPYCHCAAPTQ